MTNPRTRPRNRPSRAGGGRRRSPGLAAAVRGYGLLQRYSSTAEPAVLDAAINQLEQAVAASPTDDPNRAGYLSNLGIALQDRFERTDQMADLDRAVALFEQAVAATPTDDPNRAGYLSNLSLALVRRFERTDQTADLDRAVGLFGQAAAATPNDHPNRALYLTDLGTVLIRRFRRTGASGDLDRAVEVCGQALAASPIDRPDRAGFLSNLGLALQARFQRTGGSADLDRAIEVGGQALAVTTRDDPNRAGYLSNLGLALQARFQRTGQPADLDRAIDLFGQAVAATPTDHPNRALFLSNLSLVLVRRFQRTGGAADLDRAIDVGGQAVAATPTDHPDRGQILTVLGNALRARFERTGEPADLDRAIEVSEQALAATPTDDPNWAAGLSNLGNALRARFQATGQPADLDGAIAFSEQAVAASPTDHPNRAMYLSNLGIALHARYEATDRLPDLVRAAGVFQEASGVVSAAPIHRAEAASLWGRAAGRAGDWPQAVQAFTTGVGLLGQVAPRGLARADQEHQLTQLAGIGPEAAAACLQAADRDPDIAATLRGRAVELFEQGRAVLFAQALDTRTDLTDLADVHPDLAEHFTDLVTTLGQLTGEATGQPGVDPRVISQARMADARRRWEASEELERLLEQIRSLDNFSRFLLPRPIRDLLPAAGSGSIVLVNITALRSDALILTPAGVEVLALPGLSPTNVADQVNVLLDALAEAQDLAADPPARAGGEDRISGVLGWLWDTITGPVLDHLQITGPPEPGQPWPRVYWCPAGLVAFLPLHAAGHHHTRHDPTPLTVLDRVVSSTTPTVRALHHARHTPAPAGPGPQARVLVVAMPHTPGQPDLPGAAREAHQIADLLPGRVDILGLPDTPPATRDTVLAALPGHPWAHFSCHGAANLDNPSASHLLLTDHQDHPLTVLDLARTPLPGAQLAYLSACTTARTGARLPDEPIHLAAACQLAGYSHVIATLWPIHDDDATQVTHELYQTLTPTLDADTAADALHTTTHGQRAQHPHHPSRWAPHTHTGP